MELGVSMFADLPVDPMTGKHVKAKNRLKELLEEIKLADQVGLDVFGVGEHHRSDYAVSSPETILAAASTITQNIKLGSAVTVLSSSDPVKIYQRFATIDLISDGRAELIAGRGSFVESFPLFGYDLKDYNRLFEEKLDLLLAINQNEEITWKGTVRPALTKQKVLPRASGGGLPIWIASGGTPESILRAGKMGLPLMVAIIGGYPSQFKRHFAFYENEYKKRGYDMTKYQVGIHSHGLISDDRKKVIEDYFPLYAAQMDRIGRERGWPGYTMGQFEMGISPMGALFVGEPAEITDKILAQVEMFGLTRFVMHMDVGGPSHQDLMKSIELLGTKVAPEVRKAVAK